MVVLVLFVLIVHCDCGFFFFFFFCLFFLLLLLFFFFLVFFFCFFFRALSDRCRVVFSGFYLAMSVIGRLCSVFVALTDIFNTFFLLAPQFHLSSLHEVLSSVWQP